MQNPLFPLVMVWAVCTVLLAAPYLTQASLAVIGWWTRRQRSPGRAVPQHLAPRRWSVLVPAHNEERHLRQTLTELDALRDGLHDVDIIVALDGCTDNSLGEVRRADVDVQVLQWPQCRGKAATLRALMLEAEADHLVFVDASSSVPADLLHRAADAFAARRDVGVVLPRYATAEGERGEGLYWRWSQLWRRGAQEVGLPLGAHGACWLARKDALTLPKANVVNDDYVLPFLAAAAGWAQALLPDVVVHDREEGDTSLRFSRLRRIAAGNLQMLFVLGRSLGVSLRPWFSLVCLKFLKTAGPLFFLLSTTAALLAAPQAPAFAALALSPALLVAAPGRLGAMMRYGLLAQLAMAVGWADALRRSMRSAPSPTVDALQAPPSPPTTVQLLKRLLDVVAGTVGLTLATPVLALCIVAIRLESKGDAVFRQTRLGVDKHGRLHPFTLYKLRSMRNDAEVASGPVWATENDPRVTTVGRFLRKSRLDELPQLVNVLKGDMSLIGPRPERPHFTKQLEQDVAGYHTRLLGIKPGITGWAQVHCAYDTSVDSVREKLMYDLSYVANLQNPWTYLRMESAIFAKTLQVMVSGRGAR